MAFQTKIPLIFLLASFALILLLQLLGNEQTSADAQLVDGSASGTILANLLARKKRQLWSDGTASGTLLNNIGNPNDFFNWNMRLPMLFGRKKRQLYSDGSASGTILSNIWG
jgi:hypothetical protein